MNRRTLLVVVGAVVVVLVALGLRRRRDEVRIEIEGPDSPAPDRDVDPGGGGSDGGGRSGDVGDSAAVETAELEAVEGIGPAYAERLRGAGVDDVADLVSADPGDLAGATGIAEGRIRNWIERAGDRDDG